jgi:hypothetical protein
MDVDDAHGRCSLFADRKIVLPGVLLAGRFASMIVGLGREG